MDNLYFLTRQTVNLMADFVRAIDHGTSLFLLYGETGVGKSRLLGEVQKKQLKGKVIHRVDFKATNDNGSDNGSNDITRDIVVELERVSSASSKGDVVIIDHFEMGDSKAQHQMFKAWSVVAAKGSHMIVATINTSFIAFQQLAEQYQIDVQSFQLMPLDTNEVKSYVYHKLLLDEAAVTVRIPKSVKSQIHRANGIFTRLDDVINREGADITVTDRQVGIDLRSWMVVGLLTTLIFLAALGYYFLISPSTRVEVPLFKKTIKTDSITDSTKPAIATIEKTEEGMDRRVTELEETLSVSITSEDDPDLVEEDSVPDLELPLVLPIVAEQVMVDRVVETNETNNDPLEAKLSESLDWILQGDRQHGTIQVMSVRSDRFDNAAFLKYSNNLNAVDLDTNLLRIYKTMAGSREVYSLVYGEFENVKATTQAIKRLSKKLGAVGPIPRTLGRIAEEIKALSGSSDPL